MKIIQFLASTYVLSALTLTSIAQADLTGSKWLGHDRNRPLPAVVDPGLPSVDGKPGKAPSDAVVLFDGTSLSAWSAMDGQPTKWVNHDGALECVPGSGYARTVQSFGECQLHIEFATPNPTRGNSQNRGNSGVFFGMGRYEVQVLDSSDNKTYADGSCGSVYNQYPPLVNVSRKPGEWQTYDILWTPPRFTSDGSLHSPARITVFHNGVVIQNNVDLIGETSWLQRAPYKAHPEKLPLALQDHGNPVRYRNIWVRELGATSKPEFYLSDAILDRYVGTYGRWEITRNGGNLLLNSDAGRAELFAESPTHFFSKVVDIQAEFDSAENTLRVTVGEDVGDKMKRK